MRLFKLLSDNVGVREIIGQDKEIFDLVHDSKAAKDGSLFFCLKGKTSDGHNFALDAAQKGASAIVTEKQLDLPSNVTQVVVDNSRSAMAIIASNFFGNPASKLKLIGITGTNGKTTTTYILKQIADCARIKAGVIGTSGVIIDKNKYPPTLTTPDPIELHRIFADMVKSGIQWAIMEVSAHAIDLRKIDGLKFDIVALTNCTHDHLDYFGTMERYRNTKRKLFSHYYAKTCVVNTDDELGREIFLSKLTPSCFAYGCENPADAFAIDCESSFEGQKYLINIFDILYEIEFSLPGKYNMYNSLCAALVAYLMGVDIEIIAQGIKTLKLVSGRYNIIKRGEHRIIIDYAHTPDGLKNILNSIKEYAKGKIITVFGCGGDRDRRKRPEMGRIVTEMSDFTIITSDNPRFEEPMEIIREIEQGVTPGKEYTCISDRKQAIARALEYSSDGDIILIAGKGDEPYQDIKGVKTPYSDYNIVMELTQDGK